MNRFGWKLLMTALACTVTALTADEPPRKTQPAGTAMNTCAVPGLQRPNNRIQMRNN